MIIIWSEETLKHILGGDSLGLHRISEQIYWISLRLLKAGCA